MRIKAVHASRAARRHMRDKHGVEFWEVSEALLGDRPARKGRHGTYVFDGRTEDGRRLRVFFRTTGLGLEVEAHVLTAYEL